MCSTNTVLRVAFFFISVASSTAYEFTLAGRLPTPRYNAAAIFDGHHSCFIIGGMRQGAEAYHDVLRYNILSEEVTNEGSILPNIYGGAIGTDGSGTFYHYGGSNLEWNVKAPRSRVNRNEKWGITIIYRFTADEPQPLASGNLPFPMSHHTAVSDNRGSVYLLGWEGIPTEVVLKHDTHSGELYVVGRLPKPFQLGAAAWFEGSIYAFGGVDNEFSKKSIKFNTADGTSSVLEATLPHGSMYSSAVVVGTDIYILGGINDENKFVFLRFDTTSETVEKLEITNYDRELLVENGVYVESLNRIYIFGGTQQIINYNNDEIYYVQL